MPIKPTICHLRVLVLPCQKYAIIIPSLPRIPPFRPRFSPSHVFVAPSALKRRDWRQTNKQNAVRTDATRTPRLYRPTSSKLPEGRSGRPSARLAAGLDHQRNAATPRPTALRKLNDTGGGIASARSLLVSTSFTRRLET